MKQVRNGSKAEPKWEGSSRLRLENGQAASGHQVVRNMRVPVHSSFEGLTVCSTGYFHTGMEQGDNRWRTHLGTEDRRTRAPCGCGLGATATYSGSLHVILECKRLEAQRRAQLDTVRNAVTLAIADDEEGKGTHTLFMSGLNSTLLGGNYLQGVIPRSQKEELWSIERGKVL